MLAVIKGIALEVIEKEDKDTKEKILCARLFQKGEKKLVEVKGVPDGLIVEGEPVELECKLFPWANDRGLADISCSYVGD